MLCQAASAQMKLVDLTLHRRSLSTAQIATAAHPLIGSWRQVAGSDRRLHGSRFRVNTDCHDERTKRKLTGANFEQVRIGMFAQGGGQEAKPNEH